MVIPTFNHATVLRRALESVIAQSFKDWEAIVVNNFSTDDTISVVESFNDPRISLLNFKNHGIIAASRNAGIDVAKGKYIAFLDSDDTWYPSKLQRCAVEAEKNAEFVCHGELWINDDVSPREVMYGPARNAKYENLLYRGNCISTSATFIRTDLLKSVHGFDESTEIVTAEDYDLWLRLAALNPKIVFIPEILGEFHRLKDSASSAVMRNLASEKVVLAKHFSFQQKNIFSRLRARHRLAIANYGAARQLTNQPLGSFVLFGQAFLLSPFVFRIYPGIMLLLINKIVKRFRK